MSHVETVALWAGLISSIASIVLSIVAIVFAIWVNSRASEINDQMIRSLQKIESSVERVSTDTRELITAGWNKMLGGIGPNLDLAPTAESPNAISKGLATEIKSELLDGVQEEGALSDPEKIKRLERALQDLQETVAAQLREEPVSRRSGSIDSLVARINRLPMEAKAVLSILAGGRHLDKKQYRAALDNPNLAHVIRGLRRAGLLVPLEGLEDGKATPVYHMPPDLSDGIRIAVQLVGDVPSEVRSKMETELRALGYVPSRIS